MIERSQTPVRNAQYNCDDEEEDDKQDFLPKRNKPMAVEIAFRRKATRRPRRQKSQEKTGQSKEEQRDEEQQQPPRGQRGRSCSRNNKNTKSPRPPLLFALIEHEEWEQARQRMESHPEECTQTFQDEFALSLALQYQAPSDFMDILLAKVVIVQERTTKTTTTSAGAALLMACQYGASRQVIQQLMMNDPSAIRRVEEGTGRLPLHYAVLMCSNTAEEDADTTTTMLDVIRMLVIAYPDGCQQRDENEKRPVDLLSTSQSYTTTSDPIREILQQASLWKALQQSYYYHDAAGSNRHNHNTEESQEEQQRREITTMTKWNEQTQLQVEQLQTDLQAERRLIKKLQMEKASLRDQYMKAREELQHQKGLLHQIQGMIVGGNTSLSPVNKVISNSKPQPVESNKNTTTTTTKPSLGDREQTKPSSSSHRGPSNISPVVTIPVSITTESSPAAAASAASPPTMRMVRTRKSLSPIRAARRRRKSPQNTTKSDTPKAMEAEVPSLSSDVATSAKRLIEYSQRRRRRRDGRTVAISKEEEEREGTNDDHNSYTNRSRRSSMIEDQEEERDPPPKPSYRPSPRHHRSKSAPRPSRASVQEWVRSGTRDVALLVDIEPPQEASSPRRIQHLHDQQEAPPSTPLAGGYKKYNEKPNSLLQRSRSGGKGTPLKHLGLALRAAEKVRQQRKQHHPEEQETAAAAKRTIPSSLVIRTNTNNNNNNKSKDDIIAPSTPSTPRGIALGKTKTTKQQQQRYFVALKPTGLVATPPAAALGTKRDGKKKKYCFDFEDYSSDDDDDEDEESYNSDIDEGDDDDDVVLDKYKQGSRYDEYDDYEDEGSSTIMTRMDDSWAKNHGEYYY